MDKHWLIFFGEQLRLATLNIKGTPRSFRVGHRTYVEPETSGFPIHWDLLRSRRGLLRSKPGDLIGLRGEWTDEMSETELRHFRALRYVEFSKQCINAWFGNDRDSLREGEAALRCQVYLSTLGSPIYALHLNWFSYASPELERWTSLLIPETSILIDPV